MASSLLPGKGGHFHLNAETLEFFKTAMAEVASINEEDDLDELIDNGDAKDAWTRLKAVDGWEYAKDKFGEKLFKGMAWEEGEYRVTVVLNSHGALKLDVRVWFDPNA